MKLKRFNDWGVIYYATARKGLSRDGTADRSRGVQLKDNQPVRVTWPDGTAENLKLESRAHRNRVSDMGHEYDVDTKLWGVSAQLHGLHVWVPVEEVNIKLLTVAVFYGRSDSLRMQGDENISGWYWQVGDDGENDPVGPYDSKKAARQAVSRQFRGSKNS